MNNNKGGETSLNWKTAAIVAAVTIGTSLGVCYYIKCRKKHNNKVENSKVNFEEENGEVFENMIIDPLKEALSLKERGNSYFKGGKYESALRCYNVALEKCPLSEKMERAKLYQNKAVALENLGRLIEEVLEPLDEALALFPRYEKALSRRSKCLETVGRHREALIDVTAAAIFDNFRTPEFLNRMENLVKKISEKEIESVKCSTDVFILQSDRYISIYLKSFPSDPLLENDYDCSSIGDNVVEGAEKCFELYRKEEFELCFLEVRNLLSSLSSSSSSSSDNNNNDDVLCRLLLLRATFYGLSCREELSLIDLNSVIDNKQASPSVTVNALIKRAMLMMIMDDMVGVDQSFTEALQIDSKCADIFYHRGAFFESCQKTDEAISDFTRALELDSEYSFAAIHKAYNEYQRNKMFGAVSLDTLKNLMNQFPVCVECHVIYAQVLLNEGNLSEAERICDKILKIQPGSGTILMTLAMIKLSQEKISEAKRLLQDTIKLDPKYAFSYHTLATIFIKDGDLQRAIELMDEAVNYARNKPELQNFIATREGIRAQWNVSVIYQIPPSEIFKQMMNAANMSL